jgi:hypothetical protein
MSNKKNLKGKCRGQFQSIIKAFAQTGERHFKHPNTGRGYCQSVTQQRPASVREVVCCEQPQPDLQRCSKM